MVVFELLGENLTELFWTVNYEALQDKLTQIRDARAALDALREEHKEKLRRVAEEAERLRQIHMAQKLQIMRQKKQVIFSHIPILQDNIQIESKCKWIHSVDCKWLKDLPFGHFCYKAYM